MRPIKLDEDIKPLSEFRANAASMVLKVRSTGRPLVLTQHGQSTAVLVDVVQYERMVEELALLRDIRLGEQQIDDGHFIEHDEARRRVMAKLGR